MAVLANIAVVDADLVNVQGDVNDYLYEGQTDFATQIDAAKREIYRKIKQDYWAKHPSLTSGEVDTKLVNVKDLPEHESLKDKIVFTALANIAFSAGQLEQAQIHQGKADEIQLDYWVDEDTDATLESGELHSRPTVVLGR